MAIVDQRAWRTFSPALEKIFFRRFLGGKLLLKFLFKLEEMKIWKNVAEYTLIVLEKK